MVTADMGTGTDIAVIVDMDIARTAMDTLVITIVMVTVAGATTDTAMDTDMAAAMDTAAMDTAAMDTAAMDTAAIDTAAMDTQVATVITEATTTVIRMACTSELLALEYGSDTDR